MSHIDQRSSRFGESGRWRTGYFRQTLTDSDDGRRRRLIYICSASGACLVISQRAATALMNQFNLPAVAKVLPTCTRWYTIENRNEPTATASIPLRRPCKCASSSTVPCLYRKQHHPKDTSPGTVWDSHDSIYSRQCEFDIEPPSPSS